MGVCMRGCFPRCFWCCGRVAAAGARRGGVDESAARARDAAARRRCSGKEETQRQGGDAAARRRRSGKEETQRQGGDAAARRRRSGKEAASRRSPAKRAKPGSGPTTLRGGSIRTCTLLSTQPTLAEKRGGTATAATAFVYASDGPTRSGGSFFWLGGGGKLRTRMRAWPTVISQRNEREEVRSERRLK